MNIVIFSENGASSLTSLINTNDENEIREFKLDELENYKQFNPALLILDFDLNKIREFCAVRKIECPILIPSPIIHENITIRALSYDYIKTPVNET